MGGDNSRVIIKYKAQRNVTAQAGAEITVGKDFFEHLVEDWDAEYGPLIARLT